MSRSQQERGQIAGASVIAIRPLAKVSKSIFKVSEPILTLISDLFGDRLTCFAVRGRIPSSIQSLLAEKDDYSERNGTSFCLNIYAFLKTYLVSRYIPELFTYSFMEHNKSFYVFQYSIYECIVKGLTSYYFDIAMPG